MLRAAFTLLLYTFSPLLRLSKKPGDTKTKKSKQVSQKYTAARLHEKGVLISIEDLQPNQWVTQLSVSSSLRVHVLLDPPPSLCSRRRFKNAIFEISPSETVGVFDVKAKFMGVHLETLQLEYQVLFLFQLFFFPHSEGGQWSVPLDSPAFLFLSGSAPAAVRRRGGNEALRPGHHQRQPAHFPSQQEILWEIEENKFKKEKKGLQTLKFNHKTRSEGPFKARTPAALPTHFLQHVSSVPIQIYALFCITWISICALFLVEPPVMQVFLVSYL